jgi:hypothetical protein
MGHGHQIPRCDCFKASFIKTIKTNSRAIMTAAHGGALQRIENTAIPRMTAPMTNTEIQNTLRNVRFNAFSACSGVQLLRILARTLATLTHTRFPQPIAPSPLVTDSNGHSNSRAREPAYDAGRGTSLRGSIPFLAMHGISPSGSLRRTHASRGSGGAACRRLSVLACMQPQKPNDRPTTDNDSCGQLFHVDIRASN